MLAAPEKSSSPATIGLIAGLVVVMLGAMAFAIPAGPIRPSGQARGGILIGHGRLSELQAELVSREGHRFLAVDFTGADMDADAYWRDPFGRIAQRGFPVWAFVSLAPASEPARRAAARATARRLATRERIQTLILAGPGAVEESRDLAGAAPNVHIVPVTPPGVELEERAVLVGPDEVADLPGVIPIVELVGRSAADRVRARKLVEERTSGEYVLAFSAVR